MFKMIIYSLMFHNVYSQINTEPLLGGSYDNNNCLISAVIVGVNHHKIVSVAEKPLVRIILLLAMIV